jgi:hypothetical protein
MIPVCAHYIPAAVMHRPGSAHTLSRSQARANTRIGPPIDPSIFHSICVKYDQSYHSRVHASELSPSSDKTWVNKKGIAKTGKKRHIHILAFLQGVILHQQQILKPSVRSMTRWGSYYFLIFCSRPTVSLYCTSAPMASCTARNSCNWPRSKVLTSLA